MPFGNTLSLRAWPCPGSPPPCPPGAGHRPRHHIGALGDAGPVPWGGGCSPCPARCGKERGVAPVPRWDTGAVPRGCPLLARRTRAPRSPRSPGDARQCLTGARGSILSRAPRCPSVSVPAAVPGCPSSAPQTGHFPGWGRGRLCPLPPLSLAVRLQSQGAVT